MALIGKRLVFAQEYLKDLNATQAAIRAGYSQRTAYAQGSRLLKDAELKAFIADRSQERTLKAGLTAERVLRETELLAHSCVDHYMVDPDTGRLVLAPGAPADAMQAVSAVKYKTITRGATLATRETEHIVEFKLWDKPGMVKLAGRHKDVHGFWDRVEVTGKDGESLSTLLQTALAGQK